LDAEIKPLQGQQRSGASNPSPRLEDGLVVAADNLRNLATPAGDTTRPPFNILDLRATMERAWG